MTLCAIPLIELSGLWLRLRSLTETLSLPVSTVTVGTYRHKRGPQSLVAVAVVSLSA